MKTAFDVKKALDYDTMIGVVYQCRKEAAQVVKVAPMPRRRRNKWYEVFPVCR